MLSLVLAVSTAVSVSGFVLLAADAVPTWVGIPTGIAGLSIPVYLWLSKTVILRSDANAMVDAVQRAATDRIAALTNRLDALIGDRDAWRAAHSAEVDARLASERAAAVLFDQAKVSAVQSDLVMKLLDVVVETRRPPDAPDPAAA